MTLLASRGGAELPAQCDLLIRHGTIYDGSGQDPFVGDVAIQGEFIAAVIPADSGGPRPPARREVEARGLAVAPGFVNMLSWADETLIQDGRSQSEIRQGVTLEVFGEGVSMGPLDERMRGELARRQGDIKYPVAWTGLDEYLRWLVRRGVSPNVASFVGASTVRVRELGYENRPPTPAELERMRQHVRQAMEEGALGVASALIYAPGCYAGTGELLALARAAGESGGMYISHLRSEGNRLTEALDEFLHIAREARVRAEVYHLKAAGEANWPKLETAIRRIEAARAEGLEITADMYPYAAAATGLDAAMPPWAQEGGYSAWMERLKDSATRKRLEEEMRSPSGDWENLYLAAGRPDRILLVGFKNPRLKPLTGKTLAEVAAQRGASCEQTILDLVLEDGSRVSTVYFLMSEENVKRQLALPWVSFCSDEGSLAPESVFRRFNPHPRAYGAFARVLGKYARDERVLPLAQAVHRLTALPAANLRLDRRGALKPGYYADVVAFDPAHIADRATYERPHQYAIGMRHVWVNGVPVLRDGAHTGAKPGQVVRGPGWKRP